MHEINVIRGPGGCFSLFVNVPHAENMPRAVSTGPQRYQKPLLPNLLVRGRPTHLHRTVEACILFSPFPSLFIPLLPG